VDAEGAGLVVAELEQVEATAEGDHGRQGAPMSAAACPTASGCDWLRDPDPQANSPWVCWLNTMSSAEVIEESARVRTEPPRMSRTVDPPPPVSTKASPAAARPPRSATTAPPSTPVLTPKAATRVSAR
jgi:hypothetical protein